jgi:hypothetical protein
MYNLAVAGGGKKRTSPEQPVKPHDEEKLGN